jgi:hypothetical protein
LHGIQNKPVVQSRSAEPVDVFARHVPGSLRKLFGKFTQRPLYDSQRPQTEVLLYIRRQLVISTESTEILPVSFYSIETVIRS